LVNYSCKKFSNETYPLATVHPLHTDRQTDRQRDGQTDDNNAKDAV